MKRLPAILLSVFIYTCTFGSPNAVITGNIGNRSLPCLGCPEMACPDVDVVKITNDTAIFVVKKNGQYIGSSWELGNYSDGDKISIYGNFYKGKDYYNTEEFYVLEIKAILHEVSANKFRAECDKYKHEDLSTSPVITIENDSVIIKHNEYSQCCPSFALNVSEIINDTLFVTFTDKAIEYCTCLCNHSIRISAAKSTSQTLKVYYNGVFYDITTTAIQNISKQNIQILPNSNKKIIEVKGIENQSNLTYTLHNLSGQMLQSGNLQPTIDVANRKGIVILTIMNNQDIVVREKIKM